jgi:hypothetical protein
MDVGKDNPSNTDVSSKMSLAVKALSKDGIGTPSATKNTQNDNSTIAQ